MKKLERTLAVITLMTIILAWFIGRFRYNTDSLNVIKPALPDANYFEKLPNKLFIGFKYNGSNKDTVGYVAIGMASGYGGPMKVAVGLDITGSINGIAIVDHKETAPFFKKILNKNILTFLIGKKYSDSFTPGKDIDTVTGATFSLNALTESVRSASRKIASNALNAPLKPEKKTPFKLGFPELLLLLLYGIGFTGYIRNFAFNKSIRWLSLLTGLIVLGFIYCIPLTLININSLLMGYWPDIHSYLYWYLIISGVLLSIMVIGKSPYCDNFCPFGATQECLKAFGGAKQRVSLKLRSYLRWIQRVLALSAILLALIYRNPTILNYEVFGTFFKLTGTRLQFCLLGIVLVTSLFVIRPWCNYLCPLRAVTDYIKLIRQWILEFLSRKSS